MNLISCKELKKKIDRPALNTSGSEGEGKAHDHISLIILLCFKKP